MAGKLWCSRVINMEAAFWREISTSWRAKKSKEREKKILVRWYFHLGIVALGFDISIAAFYA